MGRTVRVFHISDLHGRSEDGPQGERARREAPLRFRVTRKEWDKNLAALREDGRPVDLVVFTGDLGDWGDETDYPMGVELLRRTCQALDVPLNRLFVVPGNHDITRKTEEAAWKALREKLAHAGLAGSDWMAGGKAPTGFEDAWRDAVLQRQGNFWKAMTELGRAELGPWQHRHRRLGYQVQVPIDGLAAPLWVIGLDTAWLAGNDADTGSLRLTDHQVELLTSGKDGADLPGFRLALMHHRFADLADGERARRLLADRVDMVLHGHQHESAVEPWANPDHNLLVLAAGCLYEGDEHHRYPNACQMIDLELGDNGRPERVAIRFRGWAERNGLFWGDDGRLYRSAQHGRLVLRWHNRDWSVDDRPKDPPKPPWQPAASEVFTGRDDELAKLERAITAPGARVAVVAVQGMAGVGKSFLVEEFCAKHTERFGAMCRWVLDPTKPERAEIGLLEIAQQAGIDHDRVPVTALPALLAERRVLVHVDNVDSAEAAAVVVELLEKLPALPAIATGRYTALGTTPGTRWVRVEVESLDGDAAVKMLRAELGTDAPNEAELRALAEAVGGLPLALHLAAGYLRGGAYSVAGFLERLRAAGLGLAPVDRADPVWQTRSRGVVSISFQISKELFLAEAERQGESWGPALSALGWVALSGFGRELGAAVAGLASGAFERFIHAAMSMSLVRRVPTRSPPDVAWLVHPLVAEFLRSEVARTEVDARIERWVVAHGDHDDGDRAARWAELSSESSAVHTWLASVDAGTLARVLPRCGSYASSHGPVGPWLEAARRACLHPRAGRIAHACALVWAQLAARVGAQDEVLQAADLLQREGDGERDVALSAGLRADILLARGDLDEALRIRRQDQLPVFERLGDVRSKAVTMGKIADILQAHGDLDEALRIHRQDQLPVFERLGDVRAKAVTMGKIAHILQARGDLDEALRIHRQDQLPVFERLGDVREKAVTMGQIADILHTRGDLDEALRIYRQDLLPVFERLSDVRSKAVTMEKIADILQARGDLDEALRIRRQDLLPVFERLGDVREKAVTMGKIAHILQARGDLDEALRIHRQDELPVYERLADVREKAVTMGKIADVMQSRGDFDEALRIHRQDELPVYERLGDVREKAVTMGKIAHILKARGDLDEAMRIHRQDQLPVYERLGDVREKAVTMGQIADILQARGDLDEALRIRRQDQLPVYERLGDVRAKAVTMGKIADIFHARGDLDEALRIYRQDQLPIFERLGDVRGKAVTMGQIADILQARGDLDEALCIRRQDELPVYERLGDVRAKAVTMGQIADILQARGDLDEALRICREDLLPVFERLGDVREKAVTMGKIADILQARGDLDEALRIRRQDELPVYERLGDVRAKVVTMGQIAVNLQARGDLDEALRIHREDLLPVLERLGGRDLVVGLANLGSLLIQHGLPADLREARGHLERAAAMAVAMRIPFPNGLLRWLRSSAGHA